MSASDNFMLKELVYYLMREVIQAYIQTEMIQPEDRSHMVNLIL